MSTPESRLDTKVSTSYLQHLQSLSSAEGMSLHSVVKQDLGVNLSRYSPDAQKGFLQLLEGLRGFAGRPYAEFATQSPIYASLAINLPNNAESVNFVQAFLHDSVTRDSIVRACALLVDRPDMLKQIVTGRLSANYYGELIDRKLGDETINLIAQLADSYEATKRELSHFKQGSEEAISQVVKRLRGEAIKVVDLVFGKELHHALTCDPEGYSGFWTHLLDPLDTVTAKQRMFVACFKELRELGKVRSLADVNAIKAEKIRGSELVQNERELSALTELYKQNWPSAGEALVRDFVTELSNKGAYVQKMIFHDELLAFMAVVPIDEHTVHLNALNSPRGVAETRPGMSLFSEVLHDIIPKEKTAVFEALPDTFKAYARYFRGKYSFERDEKKDFVDPRDGKLTYVITVRPANDSPQ